jgi:hypothetical protein
MARQVKPRAGAGLQVSNFRSRRRPISTFIESTLFVPILPSSTDQFAIPAAFTATCLTTFPSGWAIVPGAQRCTSQAAGGRDEVYGNSN